MPWRSLAGFHRYLIASGRYFCFRYRIILSRLTLSGAVKSQAIRELILVRSQSKDIIIVGPFFLAAYGHFLFVLRLGIGKSRVYLIISLSSYISDIRAQVFIRTDIIPQDVASSGPRVVTVKIFLYLFNGIDIFRAVRSVFWHVFKGERKLNHSVIRSLFAVSCSDRR